MIQFVVLTYLVLYTQRDFTHNVSRITTASGSDPNHAFLVDPVLLFIKAFCLRGAKYSLKKLVCERLVACGKRALWEVCGSALES